MKFDSVKYKENKIYSQSGQDAFVLSYFNKKRNGVFVDIGANNGISFSNTYHLEKELGWTGICVEPIPVAFEKLMKNRNCIKINKAVSNNNNVVKFTIANLLSGITDDYDERHVKRIEKTFQKVDEIDMQCILLNDLLEKHGIFYVDYMNIDTEGNEFKIVKAFDFERFDIELLTIENNYRDPKQTEFIKSKGYEFIGRLGADETFSKIRK